MGDETDIPTDGTPQPDEPPAAGTENSETQAPQETVPAEEAAPEPQSPPPPQPPTTHLIHAPTVEVLDRLGRFPSWPEDMPPKMLRDVVLDWAARHIYDRYRELAPLYFCELDVSKELAGELSQPFIADTYKGMKDRLAHYGNELALLPISEADRHVDTVRRLVFKIAGALLEGTYNENVVIQEAYTEFRTLYRQLWNNFDPGWFDHNNYSFIESTYLSKCKVKFAALIPLIRSELTVFLMEKGFLLSDAPCRTSIMPTLVVGQMGALLNREASAKTDTPSDLICLEGFTLNPVTDLIHTLTHALSDSTNHRISNGVHRLVYNSFAIDVVGAETGEQILHVFRGFMILDPDPTQRMIRVIHIQSNQHGQDLIRHDGYMFQNTDKIFVWKFRISGSSDQRPMYMALDGKNYVAEYGYAYRHLVGWFSGFDVFEVRPHDSGLANIPICFEFANDTPEKIGLEKTATVGRMPVEEIRDCLWQYCYHFQLDIDHDPEGLKAGIQRSLKKSPARDRKFAGCKCLKDLSEDDVVDRAQRGELLLDAENRAISVLMENEHGKPLNVFK